MNKGIGFALFIFGAAAGSLVTLMTVKRKYERIADEEIKSIKEAFAKKSAGGIIKKPDEEIKSIKEAFAKKSAGGIIKKPELTEYARSVNAYRDAEAPAPYMISSEEFSENGDYEKVSLIFYDGETLADDEGDQIENAGELVGDDWMSHFGEYECDSVYVRNEPRGVDYEIILDERKYSDV